MLHAPREQNADKLKEFCGKVKMSRQVPGTGRRHRGSREPGLQPPTEAASPSGEVWSGPPKTGAAARGNLTAATSNPPGDKVYPAQEDQWKAVITRMGDLSKPPCADLAPAALALPWPESALPPAGEPPQEPEEAGQPEPEEQSEEEPDQDPEEQGEKDPSEEPDPEEQGEKDPSEEPDPEEQGEKDPSEEPKQQPKPTSRALCLCCLLPPSFFRGPQFLACQDNLRGPGGSRLLWAGVRDLPKEEYKRYLQKVDLLESSRKVKGAVIGAAAGVGVALVGVPLIICGAGFTGAGIAAGSIAAKMMSAAAIANGGGVAAGSLVAVLQSAGAVGLSASVQAGLSATLGSVGAAFGAWRSKKK